MSLGEQIDELFIDAYQKSDIGLAIAVQGIAAECRSMTLGERLELHDRVLIALRDCCRLLADELDDRE
jgi:hypothetical protein